MRKIRDGLLFMIMISLSWLPLDAFAITTSCGDNTVASLPVVVRGVLDGRDAYQDMGSSLDSTTNGAYFMSTGYFELRYTVTTRLGGGMVGQPLCVYKEAGETFHHALEEFYDDFVDNTPPTNSSTTTGTGSDPLGHFSYQIDMQFRQYTIWTQNSSGAWDGQTFGVWTIVSIQTSPVPDPCDCEIAA